MQVARTVATVICLALVTTGFARADAAAESDGGIDWLGDGRSVLHLDGDAVVFGTDDGGDPVAAKGTGGSSGEPVHHDGFATFAGATLLDQYEVRLVSSGGIEQIRPHVVAAVADAASVGPELSIRGPYVSGMAPGTGQIDVTVSSSSPCTGRWLACGGPTIVDGVVHSGQIWISPRLLGRGHQAIANTVRHEFGHTMGLAHYDGTHRGEVQIMHSRRFDADRYRAGDRAGIAFNASRAGVTIGELRYAAGRVVVGGSVTNGRPGARLRITVGDATVHRAVAGNRYRNRVRADGGRLHVCVGIEHREVLGHQACAHHVAPTRPFGVLESVMGGAVTVQASGWAVDPQTAAPIRVAMVVDGVVDLGTADRPRPDVAAAHPAYGERHGFRLTRHVLPGTHEVCVVARDVGGGPDRTLGCRTVRAGSGAAGL